MNPQTAQPYTSFYQAQQQLANIEAVDYFLAQTICAKFANTLNEDEYQVLFHLVMALSESLRDGHSCIVINDMSAKTVFAQDDRAEQNELKKHGFLMPSATQLYALLTRLGLSPEHPNSLLIVDNQRLYLRRYWQFERELADHIKQRVNQVTVLSERQIAENQDIMKTLFASSDDHIDWQKVAVANALNKSFSIIAGGPGTGKTYTVTKLLVGLLLQQPDAHIAMVAPTGKAAQRLSESIDSAVAKFRTDSSIDGRILDAINSTASTIHRLLGVIKNSPNFRHDQKHPLNIDVLLIDEVSMVDLPMMARVFRALPKHCKVILLGDADQLPSVATGSVLADLAPLKETSYSESNRNFINQICHQQIPNPIQSSKTSASLSYENASFDYLTYLVLSRRFDGRGGIGLIAKAVINGEVESSWQLLTSQQHEQLSYVGELKVNDYIRQICKAYYSAIFKAESIEQAFKQLHRFRILAPTRTGEIGLESLNALVEQELQKQGHIPFQQSVYRGLPIMIGENHYGVNLFNGDIGLIWPNSEGKLMAYFQDQDGYRALSLARLPKFETVYAMTIHKTQGSEFEHVALMLPSAGANRLLSRELIYTGITRAKSHLQIFTQQDVWHQGVSQKVSRASGLTERIVQFSTSQ
ncbi:exodeoxyribonuclease V subunit alpha [Thalassotalea aquiviva]|uniref:exodeoxyribonuclease V subunit alpha n=1 Tax=Thalassotalea aquiviva TaxID=3242415 RepID=UPI00352AA62A